MAAHEALGSGSPQARAPVTSSAAPPPATATPGGGTVATVIVNAQERRSRASRPSECPRGSHSASSRRTAGAPAHANRGRSRSLHATGMGDSAPSQATHQRPSHRRARSGSAVTHIQGATRASVFVPGAAVVTCNAGGLYSTAQPREAVATMDSGTRSGHSWRPGYPACDRRLAEWLNTVTSSVPGPHTPTTNTSSDHIGSRSAAVIEGDSRTLSFTPSHQPDTQYSPYHSQPLPDILNSHILPPYNAHATRLVSQTGPSPGSSCQVPPPAPPSPPAPPPTRPHSAVTVLHGQAEGKRCCCCGAGRCGARCAACVTRLTRLRWLLGALGCLGVLCVTLGIVLACLHMTTGVQLLTVALLFIGLGLVLVVLVGVGWRCSPPGHEPCHVLLGLGAYSSSRRNRNRAAAGSRPRAWHAGPLYAEFAYRPPPPSYLASMRDYEQRRAAAERAERRGEVGSPPPTYRSRGSDRPNIFSNLLNRSRRSSLEVSRPPTYRSYLSDRPRRPDLTTLHTTDIGNLSNTGSVYMQTASVVDSSTQTTPFYFELEPHSRLSDVAAPARGDTRGERGGVAWVCPGLEREVLGLLEAVLHLETEQSTHTHQSTHTQPRNNVACTHAAGASHGSVGEPASPLAEGCEEPRALHHGSLQPSSSTQTEAPGRPSLSDESANAEPEYRPTGEANPMGAQSSQPDIASHALSNTKLPQTSKTLSPSRSDCDASTEQGSTRLHASGDGSSQSVSQGQSEDTTNMQFVPACDTTISDPSPENNQSLTSGCSFLKSHTHNADTWERNKLPVMRKSHVILDTRADRGAQAETKAARPSAWLVTGAAQGEVTDSGLFTGAALGEVTDFGPVTDGALGEVTDSGLVTGAALGEVTDSGPVTGAAQGEVIDPALVTGTALGQVTDSGLVIGTALEEVTGSGLVTGAALGEVTDSGLTDVQNPGENLAGNQEHAVNLPDESFETQL